MTIAIRRNLKEWEEFEYKRGFKDVELQAARLRQIFFNRHIVNFDTNLYKTVVERDWGYIAKREYNYDVRYRSWMYGAAWGNVAMCARMFMLKKAVFWPLPVVGVLGAIYYQPIMFLKHNKKLFDMCNVGEQYFLGKKRNEVLRECNRLLDREDF